MKLKNKGFVLMEFLVSTTIIMVLFTSVFILVSPEIDKLEKKVSFENVDNTYFLFHIRKLYMNEEFNINHGEYITLYDGNTCQYLKEENIEKCNSLMRKIKAEELILTTSDIAPLKSSYNGNLKSYIKYLPKQKESTYLKLILKTETGYAISDLYSDLKIDKEGPACTFTKDEDTLVLKCIDENEIIESDITTDSFTISEEEITIEIANKTEITDGYEYKIALNNITQDFTIELKENILKDKYGNTNEKVTESYTIEE